MTIGRVLGLWWPLAASWLLMAAELPLMSAVVARLPDPRVHLAAFGSIVFPVALVIEAPIIMLLAASTALATDRRAYRWLARFTHGAGLALTLVHGLVAFTPLFEVVVEVLGTPEEVVDSARTGLRILLPWTWAIASRRFQQGLLIRAESSRRVTQGTLVRLFVNAGVLAAGAASGRLPGIAVGTLAISAGVTSEALFVAWFARPVVRSLPEPAPDAAPITGRSFARFYVPLAMTPLMTLLIQPIGAAAMSRMPNAMASLAVWPAVHGLVFLTRSVGMAYNEVVVALLGEPGGRAALARFTRILALVMMGILALVALTPAARLWFQGVTGFEPDLADLSRTGLFFALLMPGYAVLQSWYQGALVHGRRTRGISEAVALYLASSCVWLFIGVRLEPLPALHWALLAFSASGVLQTAWLWWRYRGSLPGPDRIDRLH